MKEYVSSLDIMDRLNPRDSFFGGRTNAIKLYHETDKPGETIEHYDYTRYVFRSFPSLHIYYQTIRTKMTHTHTHTHTHIFLGTPFQMFS